MIVHTIDIRESGPGGLVTLLEPHEFPRAGEVEARAVGPSWGGCCVESCDLRAWSEITVHRRHSRRITETVYVCREHIDAHRAGDVLRLVVESNR